MTQASSSIDIKQDWRPKSKGKSPRQSRRWEHSSCFPLSASSSQLIRFHLGLTWRTLRRCTRKLLTQSLVDSSWSTHSKMISSSNSSARRKGSNKGLAISRPMKSTKGWNMKQTSKLNWSEKCRLIMIKFCPTKEQGTGWWLRVTSSCKMVKTKTWRSYRELTKPFMMKLLCSRTPRKLIEPELREHSLQLTKSFRRKTSTRTIFSKISSVRSHTNLTEEVNFNLLFVFLVHRNRGKNSTGWPSRFRQKQPGG